MDPRVAKLKSVEECENFAKNASERGHPELAVQARERAIQLLAQSHGAKLSVERECLEAIYALEDVRGRRASRTWQAVKRHGIIETVERVVSRPQVSEGFKMLDEAGLKDYAFENVVLRHLKSFSAGAVEISRQRLGNSTYKNASAASRSWIR